jgi:hypothetical protein
VLVPHGFFSPLEVNLLGSAGFFSVDVRFAAATGSVLRGFMLTVDSVACDSAALRSYRRGSLRNLFCSAWGLYYGSGGPGAAHHDTFFVRMLDRCYDRPDQNSRGTSLSRGFAAPGLDSHLTSGCFNLERALSTLRFWRFIEYIITAQWSRLQLFLRRQSAWNGMGAWDTPLDAIPAQLRCSQRCLSTV